jgi:Flp pilus assembly CpaE family ATPase
MYGLKALPVACEGQTLVDVERELEKLSIAIEGPVRDVEACLSLLSAQPADNRLLIVHAGTAFGTEVVKRVLAAAFQRPVLVLVDAGGDVSAFEHRTNIEAIELPFRPDDLRSAVHRLVIQSPQAASRCRTVLVVGAMEDVGSTTISVNLASELARFTNRACILGEQSVAFGRLANYLGIRPKVTLYDLVSDLDHMDEERMREAMTPIADNLYALVGSYREITPFTITTETAFKALACAMQLAQTVVVDARHQFEEVDLEFAAKSQHVVLVAKPTIPSLHAMRTLLQALVRRAPIGKHYVVINQYQASPEAISRHSIEGHLNEQQIFFVASDPAIENAENCGRLLRKSAPESEALRDMSTLARAILGLPAEEPPRPSLRNSLKRMAQSLNLG